MTNPYQTPEGQLTDDDQAYGDIKFFAPGSRINRLRYWAHGMLIVIAFYVLVGIGYILWKKSGLFYAGGAVIAVAYIALISLSFIVMIQRLHDLNKSGWMSLLALVPLVNIYLIVLLIFFKGTSGRNHYGLQTPPNKIWHWVLGLTMPVIAAIVVIGIVAAIAIPAYKEYESRAKAAQSSQQDNAYPSEYTDEAAYPAEDSSDMEDATDYAEETPESTTSMEEPLPEDAVETVDEESAIMDEVESETPQ